MPRVIACLLLAAALVSPRPARAEINLNIYGSAEYWATYEGAVTNQFAVPKLSLLYAQQAGRFFFLGEALFEVLEDNAFAIDLDRLEIGYAATDWFRVRAGRFHSAVGYYNDAYHHGAYFMPTIRRPTMVEDDGFGLLPGFSVGVALDGRIRLGGAGYLRYDAQVANTRGRHSDDTQSLYDLQNPKAVVLRLRYEASGALDGLILGGNVVFNWIPEDQDGDGEFPKMRERIYGAHLVYLEHDVHLISEFLWVEHEALVGGQVYKTWGVFGELGYNFGNLLPLVRYERVRFLGDAPDPFYNELAHEAGNFQRFTAGLKYTLNGNIALKIAGDLDLHDDRSLDYRGSAQIAFGF